MLTVTEDMLLLTLEKNGGRFPSRDSETLQHALIGSALLDLELASRIDTDLENLVVIDRTPTGKPFLDPVLEQIANSEKNRDIWGWLVTLSAEMGDSIRENAVAGLVERGILDCQERRALGFRSLRFRQTAETGELDAKQRLEQVLFSEDEIPDPHGIALICIADACDLLQFLFGKKRMRGAADRMQQLRKMDLVGSGTVAQFALWQLEHMPL